MSAAPVLFSDLAGAISELTPASTVVRAVGEEMGIAPDRLLEFIALLDSECILTVEDLKLMEPSHWRDLGLPSALAAKVKAKIKDSQPPPRTRIHIDDADEEAEGSQSPLSNSGSNLARSPSAPLATSGNSSTSTSSSGGGGGGGGDRISSDAALSDRPTSPRSAAEAVATGRGSPSSSRKGWINAMPRSEERRASAPTPPRLGPSPLSQSMSSPSSLRNEAAVALGAPPPASAASSTSSTGSAGASSVLAASTSGVLIAASSSGGGISGSGSPTASLREKDPALAWSGDWMDFVQQKPPVASSPSKEGRLMSASSSSTVSAAATAAAGSSASSSGGSGGGGGGGASQLQSPAVVRSKSAAMVRSNSLSVLNPERSDNPLSRSQTRTRNETTLSLSTATVSPSPSSSEVADASVVWNQPTIENGTLDQLMAAVVPEEGIPDWKFILDFLVVYRYLTTPQKFLQLLVTKYQSSQQREAARLASNGDASAPVRKKGGDTVQLRVINILRKWVSLHFYDFDENPDVKADALTFVESSIGSDHPVAASRLILSFQEKEPDSILPLLTVEPSLEVISEAMKKPSSRLLASRELKGKKQCVAFLGNEAVSWWMRYLKNAPQRAGGIKLGQRLLAEGYIQCLTGETEFTDSATSFYAFLWRSENQEEFTPPKPKKLPSGRVVSVTEYPPMEVARQLTLIEFELFRAIKPTEIRSQAWARKDAEKVSPHVCRLVDLWNKHGCWAATEIVLTTDVEKRRDALKWFLQFCEALREIRNYNALISIVAGLNFAAISRLKSTWKVVSSKTMQTFNDLTNLSAPISNYKIYREELKTVQSGEPCLPYLGVYLKDLTFIEDGNKDFLDAEKTVINFTKMKMISAVFHEIQKYQHHAYQFIPQVPVVDHLRNRRIIADQNELYEKSSQTEGGSSAGSTRVASSGSSTHAATTSSTPPTPSSPTTSSTNSPAPGSPIMQLRGEGSGLRGSTGGMAGHWS